jgi:signal recognition particle receptor subunit beta
MDQPLKLVVSGPVGAGKTTFIRSLSVIDVIETEEVSSEDIGKETTTVAFDFGILSAEDTVVHLYGTPGQDRFNFMWEVLCEGALGLILLIPGDRPSDYPHARRILEFVTSRIPVPFIVGVTRQDLGRVWEPEDVAAYFDLDIANVVAVNATQRESALSAITALLKAIEKEDQEVNPTESPAARTVSSTF